MRTPVGRGNAVKNPSSSCKNLSRTLDWGITPLVAEIASEHTEGDALLAWIARLSLFAFEVQNPTPTDH
jgi:hypothetical protein